MKYLTAFLLIVVSIMACQEPIQEMDNIVDTPVFEPPTEETDGEFHGEVLDKDGNAVVGALIEYEGSSTFTDAEGSFVVSGQKLYKDGSFFKVMKDGYFDTSRKFYPDENDNNKFIIRMMRQEKVGSIDAAAGGQVSFNDVEIDFPTGIYTDTDGNIYEEEVEIFAAYLDPTLEETFDQMPGDLTGLDANGRVQGLITYGMVVVELKDGEGNQIHLPEGEHAILSMPVSEEQLSNAPATIPLWYFDEDHRTWVEEGEAQLVGDTYVGEVSHFSFWNCDAPFPVVEISGTISSNIRGASFGRLKITDTTTGFCAFGYTSEGAFYSGKVPQNRPLLLSVYDGCGSIVETFDIGPFSTDTDEVDVFVDVPLNNFSISGNITQCNGDAISLGWAVVKTDEFVSRSDISTDGYFEFTFENCTVANVSVIGIDAENNTQSNALSIVTDGSQNIGTLNACEEYVPFQNIIIYENINWGFMDTLDGLYPSYVTNDLGNMTEYTVSILDWFTTVTTELIFVYDPSNPGQGEYSGFNMIQGFEIAGTCDVYFDEEGELERITDLSTEITVTDESLYPGNIEHVYFDLNFYD